MGVNALRILLLSIRTLRASSSSTQSYRRKRRHQSTQNDGATGTAPRWDPDASHHQTFIGDRAAGEKTSQDATYTGSQNATELKSKPPPPSPPPSSPRPRPRPSHSTASWDVGEISNTMSNQPNPNAVPQDTAPPLLDLLKHVLDLRDKALGSRILLQNDLSNYMRQRSHVAEKGRRFTDLLREHPANSQHEPFGEDSTKELRALAHELLHSMELLSEQEGKMRKSDKMWNRAENKLWEAESRLYDQMRPPKASYSFSSSSSVGSPVAVNSTRETEYEVISMDELSAAENSPLLQSYRSRLKSFNDLCQKLLEVAASNRRAGDSLDGMRYHEEPSIIQQGEPPVEQHHETQAKLIEELSITNDDLLLMRGQLLHEGIIVAGPSLPIGLSSTIPEEFLQNVRNLAGTAFALRSTTPPIDETDKANVDLRVSGWLSELDSNDEHSRPASPASNHPLPEESAPDNEFATALYRTATAEDPS